MLLEISSEVSWIVIKFGILRSTILLSETIEPEPKAGAERYCRASAWKNVT